MGTIITVFLKEVLDNIRDRRTLASALLMGPIFGPVLFSFVINLSIERSLEDAEKTLELPVIGEQHAPNLVEFLRSRNIDTVDGPEDLAAAMDAVKIGDHDVVLVIPEAFGEQLGDMTPALVQVVSDQADRDADRDARRVHGAVREYGQLITGLRKNMKNRLLPVMDKLLLRKRAIIETINDQLKNISQIAHTRHRSVPNFLVNVIAGLIAYTHQPKKPALNLQNEKLASLPTLI